MSSNENTSSSNGKLNLKGIGNVLGSLIGLGILLLILFRMFFVDYIDQHEFGYKVERLKGGKLSTIPEKGYVVTLPFVTKVYAIEMRPRQVCQKMGSEGNNSSNNGVNSRVLNCKLVEFNPAGLKTLIDWHGVQEGDISGILGIYAYDQLGRSYPFLFIKEQSAPAMGQEK